MNEQDYSNREIREFVSDIKNTLERIETQTVKTNGRVNKLEAWRSYIAGGVAAIAFMGAPLLWYMFNQVQSVSTEVDRMHSRIPDSVSTSIK